MNSNIIHINSPIELRKGDTVLTANVKGQIERRTIINIMNVKPENNGTFSMTLKLGV